MGLALLATLIPSLGMAWISYVQNRSALTDKITEELKSVSEQTAREIDLWVKERLYDVRVFASSYEVTENIERARRSAGGGQAGARLSNPEVDSLVTVLTELRNASVLTVGETQTDDAGGVVANRFQVKVASPKGIGDEDTITNAIVGAIVWEFGDQLDVTQSLTFVGAGSDEHAQFTFTVEKDTLGECINRPQYTDRVIGFKGGVAVVIDEIDPPVTPDDVTKRIDRMRSQRDFAQRGALGRDVKVIGLEPVEPTDLGQGYRSVAVLVYDSDLSSRKVDFDTWDERLARTEWRIVSQALQRRSSLEQVRAFSSAVAQTLAANAIVAVGLSLLGILLYIWVRFGSLRYSVAAITALVHDVTIALGLLALTGLIAKTAFAGTLLIEEFRIDLGVVAAMLAIIGYSLNDTIVILDRIRENRGKLPIPTAAIVNRSINQTMSRTLLTSTTTLLAVVIMYIQGGSGIRPFTFCLLVGLIVGTYSSVAIAAPLVIRREGAGPGSEDKEAFWKKENAPEGA
ncbi:MAG: protein translocase subunit SecF [Planctomycetes bacterium]|nr:protein translocase subunit SecF [Planctomycetota bacterium]